MMTEVRSPVVLVFEEEFKGIVVAHETIAGSAGNVVADVQFFIRSVVGRSLAPVFRIVLAHGCRRSVPIAGKDERKDLRAVFVLAKQLYGDSAGEGARSLSGIELHAPVEASHAAGIDQCRRENRSAQAMVALRIEPDRRGYVRIAGCGRGIVQCAHPSPVGIREVRGHEQPLAAGKA